MLLLHALLQLRSALPSPAAAAVCAAAATCAAAAAAALAAAAGCCYCCCYLLLLLSAAAATNAASVPAAAPELLLPHALLRCALPSSAALPEPRCYAPTEPHCNAATATATTAATTAASAAAATAPTATTATMATVSVLSFDIEGRAITFDIWFDDLQLFLQSEARDGIPLVAHTNGSLPAPPDTETTDNSKDQILALDPTELTPDSLEKSLLEAEKSTVAVAASRGTPRSPFFEGCAPSPLLPSVATTAVVDLLGAEEVDVAGGGGGGGGGWGGGGWGGFGGGDSGGGRSGGGGGGGGGSRGGGGGWGGGGSEGGGGGRGGAGKAGGRGASARGSGGFGSGQQLPRLPDNPTPLQLHEWVVQRGSSGGSGRCPYINKAIYAMYVTELSDEGACYSCVPGDAGVVAIALGARESAAALDASASTVTGASEYAVALGASASAVTGASESTASESVASAEALHTFTLDSGTSRCFFRDCTTLTPLAAPVPVSLADPSGSPVVA
ncbi:unnamed protein product [Closterium sp. NIES-53]